MMGPYHVGHGDDHGDEDLFHKVAHILEDQVLAA
jgi:hypothetical protein